MKAINNNRQNKKKHLFLRYIAIAVILIGFGLSSTNLYKFTKGYFTYQTAYTNTSQREITQETIATAYTNKDDLDPILYPVRPEIGEEIGELYIPKLDATLPIYHGTSEEELEKGVGHYADSVLPGENDNSVLAGHRDTVFRKLGKVGKGDLLIVRTSAGEFTYKVNKVKLLTKMTGLLLYLNQKQH